MAALGALALLATPPVRAHEGVDATLRQLDRDVAARPGDAALRFRRGEIHRLRRERALALADYAAARRIDPTLHVVDLGVATAELQDDPRAALEAVETYLRCVPDSIEGHRVRARALEALGRTVDAIDAWDAALEHAVPPREPDPDDYLERARLLAGAGRADAAIRCLEAGLGRLGPAIALDVAALDLEVAAGRHDAALARLRAIAARAGRKERWQLQEGRILEQLGRRAEARRAYGQARDSIAEVPAARRGAPATRSLEREIDEAIERLDAPAAVTANTPVAPRTDERLP